MGHTEAVVPPSSSVFASAAQMHRMLFGRNKAAASDTTVLKELAESKELLERREEHLQRKIELEVAAAIAHKQNNRKSQALACLKRKMMMEEEIQTLHSQQLKLDSQEHTIQSLRFNEMTLAVESRATEAIRSRVTAMGGVDKVEAQREKTEESLDDAYELLSAAAQPLSHPALNSTTDEDLLAELEEMEAAEELKKLTHVKEEPVSRETPAFPAAPIARSQENDERSLLAELDQLSASMQLEKPMPMLGSAAGPTIVVV